MNNFNGCPIFTNIVITLFRDPNDDMRGCAAPLFSVGLKVSSYETLTMNNRKSLF